MALYLPAQWHCSPPLQGADWTPVYSCFFRLSSFTLHLHQHKTEGNACQCVVSPFLLLSRHKQLLTGNGHWGLCLCVEQAWPAEQGQAASLARSTYPVLCAHPVVGCAMDSSHTGRAREMHWHLRVTHHCLMHHALRCTAQESTGPSRSTIPFPL